MKIETFLTPNCSELGLQIRQDGTESNLQEVIEKIQKTKGMKVSIDGFERKYNWNTPDHKAKNISQTKSSRIMALLLKRRHDNDKGELNGVDQLMLIRELKAIDPKIDITNLDFENMYLTVEYKKSAVSLQIGDCCGGGEDITFHTGDCDEENFPLMSKLESMFGGEIYGIDGGHTDRYEEWNGEQVSKNE